MIDSKIERKGAGSGCSQCGSSVVGTNNTMLEMAGQGCQTSTCHCLIDILHMMRGIRLVHNKKVTLQTG